MPDLSPERQRALRRRRKHERQAVIFGTLVAVLAIAAVSSAAVYTGVLSIPFLDRPFTTPEPQARADFPEPPCPTEGTLPVAYNTIQVNVLNGSGQSGLAGLTATALTQRGFLVLSTGNYPATLNAPAQVSFGQAGLASAYTLAAHLQDPLLVLDTRADATVDLILGEGFPTLPDPATVILDPAAPLPQVEGCVPLEVALSTASPAPAATPPPAEGAVEPAPEG